MKFIFFKVKDSENIQIGQLQQILIEIEKLNQTIQSSTQQQQQQQQTLPDYTESIRKLFKENSVPQIIQPYLSTNKNFNYKQTSDVNSFDLSQFKVLSNLF